MQPDESKQKEEPPKNPHERLEILIRNPDKKPLNETLNETLHEKKPQRNPHERLEILIRNPDKKRLYKQWNPKWNSKETLNLKKP